MTIEDYSVVPDEVSRTEHVEIKAEEIHISPVEDGFVAYRQVNCIYVFVVLKPEDYTPILSPDARNFDKFSWRMINRQYYALHRDSLPFGVNLYFVLEKPTDPEGLKILEEENKVFADLLYQVENEDYGKKIMSFVEIDTAQCDGWAMMDKEMVKNFVLIFID